MEGNAVLPITIKGRYLWRGSNRFIIHGAALQRHDRPPKNDEPQGPVKVTKPMDPIADDQTDIIDDMIPLFQELKFNTIFVYTIDPTKKHDETMRRLAAAGIYVLACLDQSPHHVINRNAPLATYNKDLMSHYFRVIDCLAAYPNTLGVVTSNEVINNISAFAAAPVLRAVNRDVKRYMALAAEISGGDGQRGGRRRILPVGVSVSDNRLLQQKQFDYLAAGDEAEAVDFYSFNCYSWFGEAGMQMSGYANLAEYWGKKAATHIPVFFSEYGTKNAGKPRLFRETRAILSDPDMTAAFSGGCVYEFFQGGNGYGLVKMMEERRGDGDDGDGMATVMMLEKLQDYENLKKMVNEVDAAAVVEAIVPEEEEEEGGLLLSQVERPSMQSPEDMWKPEITAGPLPESPVDWEEVRERLEDGEWVDAGDEWEQVEMDDLVERFDEGLRVE